MNLSNSVFISYRRNVSGTLALAVFQDLHYNQIDVFYDIASLDAGQFDSAILRQIAARPYFLPILTPGTLERCTEPGDWVLREIEEALRLNRMILPLHTPEFNFGDMDKYLPPDVARELKRYQAVEIPYKYFQYAMQDVRTRYLKPIDRPTTPTPASDISVIGQKQALAQVQPTVTEKQLSAQEYFARAYAYQNQGNLDAAIADYTQAIHFNPQDADAYNNRGIARKAKGDLDGAIADYTQAVQLNPQHANAYQNRGNARYNKGDLDGAIADYTQTIQLNPQYTNAYQNRGAAYEKKRAMKKAVADYRRVLEIQPDHPRAQAMREFIQKHG